MADVKEALDLCEPLWANPRNAEPVAAACIEVVIVLERPTRSSAGRQGHRLVGASDQTKKRLRDSCWLDLGNCRERQERYDEAKTLYENVIKQDARNAAASSSTNTI